MQIPPKETCLLQLVQQPGSFARRYALPLALLLIGATLDGVTTYNTMNRFGSETEMHLVQRIIMQLFGVAAGVPIAKATQVGFVILVAAWWRPWCGWILALCGLLYSVAAVSNHFMLL